MASLGFYTLHPALAVEMEKKYPPNDRQQRLCEFFKVPTHVWSFYVCKQDEIEYHLLRDPEFKGLFWNSSPPVRRQWREARVRSLPLFPDLTLDEKYFCVHAQSLEHLVREVTWMLFNPGRLQDVCATTLSQSHPARALKRLLPPLLFRKVVTPAPTPYGVTRMRFSFYDTFSERDRLFPEDFAKLFQKIPSVRCTDDLSSLHWVVFFYVTRDKKTNEVRRENLCCHCMKKELVSRKTTLLEIRYHEVRDILDEEWRSHLVRHQLFRKWSRLVLQYCQARHRWCQGCRRIPLFQCVTQKELEERYGKEELLGKKELFL